MTDIQNIPTLSLFGTICTLDAAHEPEDLAKANRNLELWGITFEQGVAELRRREQWAKEKLAAVDYTVD